MSFSLSYDRSAKLITGLVCGVLLLTGVLTHNRIVVMINTAVILVGALYAPLRYVISGDVLVIKRAIGGVRYPLADFTSARPVIQEDRKGCVRIWASGGLFGYYGLFRTDRLGKCWWYVTRQDKAVVLTGTRSIVISPDNVEGLMAAFQASPSPVIRG